MLTKNDIILLLRYFSDKYYIRQFNIGDSLFTELLLKNDVNNNNDDEFLPIY